MRASRVVAGAVIGAALAAVIFALGTSWGGSGDDAAVGAFQFGQAGLGCIGWRRVGSAEVNTVGG